MTTPAQQVAQAMQSLRIAVSYVQDANATIAWANQGVAVTGYGQSPTCHPRVVSLAPLLYQAALLACSAAQQMTAAAQAVAGAPGACDAARAHAQQAASLTASLCWYDCGGSIEQGDTRGTLTTVDSSGNAYPCLDMSFVTCVAKVVGLAQQVVPHAQAALVACVSRVSPSAHVPRFPVDRPRVAPVQPPRIGTAGGDYWTGEGSQDSERRTFNCGWVHQMLGLGHGGGCAGCGCPSCEDCNCDQKSPGFPCCGDRAPQGPTDEHMRAAAGWWVTQGSNFAPCLSRGGAPAPGYDWGPGCYGVAGPPQGVGDAAAVGGSCAQNSDCASGVCQNGVCVAASHTGWWIAGGIAAAAVVGGVLYAKGRR